MMTALASRPLRLAGALLAAGLLAACNGEAANSKSDFKPVPVTPVIGDVPQGAENAPVTLIEYAALTCHVCRDFAKQVYPRLKAEYIDTGKVRYIYRDYPLEGDPATGKAVDGFGVLLASVARCKGAATYHEMIDGIFGVQADLLDTLTTRVVVPLVLEEEMGLAAKRLNPQFKVKGVAVVMSTAELAGVPNRSLGDKVATLKNKRDEIIAALDLLFTGI